MRCSRMVLTIVVWFEGRRLKVILLGIDRADLRMMIRALKMGWPTATIRIVLSGEEGVRSVIEEPADLVLMGLSFPDWEGFELIAKIRSLSDVPIIMFSEVQETGLIKGLDTGADDCVIAPVDAGELRARIRALLRRYKSQEQGRCPFPGIATILLDSGWLEARLPEEDGPAIFWVSVN